jgi:aquaporin Z
MTTPAVTTAEAVPSDTKEFGIVAKLAAEAFGTFLLVFGGLGVALFSNPSSAPLPAPLAIGLSIGVGIAAFGHISGGHFNPAVTLGTAVAGRTPWKRVPGYIVAQLVGGAAGALILWIAVRTLPNLSNVQTIFTQLSNGVDDLSPNKFPMAAGLLAEVVATAVILAIVLAATSKRAARGVAPWAIGLGFPLDRDRGLRRAVRHRTALDLLGRPAPRRRHHGTHLPRLRFARGRHRHRRSRCPVLHDR